MKHVEVLYSGKLEGALTGLVFFFLSAIWSWLGFKDSRIFVTIAFPFLGFLFLFFAFISVTSNDLVRINRDRDAVFLELIWVGLFSKRNAKDDGSFKVPIQNIVCIKTEYADIRKGKEYLIHIIDTEGKRYELPQIVRKSKVRKIVSRISEVVIEETGTRPEIVGVIKI